MIKAIIFDFFGVLVGDGFDFTYRQAGGDTRKDRPFIQDLLDQATRGLITTEEFRKKVCDKIGISIEDYEGTLKYAEQVNAELLEYIDKLHHRYKTAILSNVNQGGLEERIKKHILDKHFDVVIASGDVGLIKPEPEIYKLALSKLGVKPHESVFIDDRERYIAGAEAVGIKSILYKDFKQMKAELEEILSAASNN